MFCPYSIKFYTKLRDIDIIKLVFSKMRFWICYLPCLRYQEERLKMNDAFPSNTVRLFYCYAHEDETHLLELEKHLAFFKRQGSLLSWSDRQVAPGKNWKQEVTAHITRAHLVILLLSPDFLYSDRCDEEMRQAIAFASEGKTRVIPIILRPVVWQETFLTNLQLLPQDGKPISRWEDRDEAWRQVAASIGRIVSDLLHLPYDPPDKPPEKLLPVAPPPAPPFEPRNPYKGLQAFTATDARDFFGRESLVTSCSILCSIRCRPDHRRSLTFWPCLVRADRGNPAWSRQGYSLPYNRAHCPAVTAGHILNQ
jgi:hypothetical protein